MPFLYITLQAKGGVGKSYVSSTLAQYFIERGRQVQCIDTDTTNPTLLRYESLNCDYLALSQDNVVNPRAFDHLVERLASVPADTHVVVDVGSNGFQSFMAYAVENDLFSMLQSLGVRVVLNAVIAGGPDAAETLHSTQALLEHTTTLALPTLIWLNAHLGSLEFNRQPIVEMELFRIHAARLLGWVTLPQYTAQTFGQDVEHMLKQRWTFQEAHERLTLMPQMRLLKVKEALWVQLDRVFATEL